jgi:hypothetical protein
MADSSSKTTGGDPVSGVDPGGTHSTKPGNPDKTAPKADEATTPQTVVSGDRNDRPPEP